MLVGQTDRHTDRQTDGQINSQSVSQSVTLASKEAGRQAGRHTFRQSMYGSVSRWPVGRSFGHTISDMCPSVHQSVAGILFRLQRLLLLEEEQEDPTCNKAMQASFN